MIRIIAPNKSYTGVSAGVAFSNGEGHTDDPYLISWFRSHGYIVEEEAVKMPPEAPENAEGTDEGECPENPLEDPESDQEEAVKGKRKTKKKEA